MSLHNPNKIILISRNIKYLTHHTRNKNSIISSKDNRNGQSDGSYKRWGNEILKISKGADTTNQNMSNNYYNLLF